MNCSWDVSQVIYLFHSYVLFLKFKRKAICRVIFIFSGQLRFLFFFFQSNPLKIHLGGKKIELFQYVFVLFCFFVVISLSLINMSNIKRKQKSPKQQKLSNRIKTLNVPLELQSVKHLRTWA